MKLKRSGAKKSSLKEQKSQELSSNTVSEEKAPPEDQPAASSPTGTVEEQPSPEQTSDLKTIVDESVAKLAEAEQVPVKKRGRPKGSKSAPKEETPANPNAAAIKEIMAPSYISSAFQMIGNQVAINTGYPGWQVAKEEADHLANLADQCMERYFPNLSEGTALLGITIFSFGMAIGGRYIGYNQFKEAQRSKRPQTETSSNGNDSREIPTQESGPEISASEFFPKGNQ